jgi:transposase
MWVAPEIHDPVLLHAPTRKSVACFGAVSLSTGRFVWQVCPVFNAETFASFLRQLLRHRRRGKRIVVVLDNARYHHAILLKPLLRKYRCHLTLLFLPPYSPQLAPIERVWKLTRRLSLHNRTTSPRSPKSSRRSTPASNTRKRPNEVLRRLCCII